MNKIQVNSSNLVAVAYSKDTQELQIEFKNGITYSYAGVPSLVFDSMMKSPSKGTFFNKIIKDNFKGEVL